MVTGTGFCLATLCVLNAETVGQYSCFVTLSKYNITTVSPFLVSTRFTF
ncbi:hypothetical protein L798_06104 [Zootermopsis nevadensis]|uniref:Uncharacterized protein n=1 Tax=Zootermopsis nevadensis TaxID=136037 RepID=A0A067R9L8_ZOONE|nr:hypothetical protein L798_06104 [Zootermopsis nevadensis]